MLVAHPLLLYTFLKRLRGSNWQQFRSTTLFEVRVYFHEESYHDSFNTFMEVNF